MNWKVFGIVFMILFILETLLLVWMFSIGSKMIQRDTECGVNVCSDFESYYYDDFEKLCYCFNDNEIVFQKYMT